MRINIQLHDKHFNYLRSLKQGREGREAKKILIEILERKYYSCLFIANKILREEEEKKQNETVKYFFK